MTSRVLEDDAQPKICTSDLVRIHLILSILTINSTSKIKVLKRLCLKNQLPLSLLSVLNELSSLCVVNTLQFLSQLNFLSMKAQAFSENPLQLVSQSVQFLTIASNSCYWTLSTTFRNCCDISCWSSCWRAARVSDSFYCSCLT